MMIMNLKLRPVKSPIIQKLPLLAIIFQLIIINHRSLGARSTSKQRAQHFNFQFTSPVYNLSIEENARGRDVFAISNDPLRIGVQIPSADAIVKFKIVEGDKQYFKAEAKIVGDFAFLRIRHENDGILNRELRDRYQFLVKAFCRRKDTTNLETTASVNLIITDSNDARPIFEKDEYRVQIFDNISVHSNVIQVEASDADIGLNSQVYYSLVNASRDFEVDPNSGWIRTLRTLPAGVHHLLLLAEDRTSRLLAAGSGIQAQTGHDSSSFPMPQLGTAKLIVSVMESRKVKPKLDIELRSISISLANISQLVAIARAQVNSKQLIVVEVVDGDFSEMFSVERNIDDSVTDTAAWFIKTVPGHRPAPEWYLQLRVIDVDDFGSFGQYTLNVSINDVQAKLIIENADQPLQQAINESTPIGFGLGKIKTKIVGGQVRRDAPIRFAISADDDVPFSVFDDTGRIYLSGQLDFENITFYRFNVIAQQTDGGLMASRMIEVTVIDSNDHSPTFAAKWARGEPIAVPVDFSVNTILLRVTALDLDSGDNARISYSIESTPVNTPFQIDPDTGSVQLRVKPASNESWWRLRVRATDSGWPFPRSNLVIVTVYRNGTDPPGKVWPSLIRDPENRHAPIFKKPETVEVQADAAVGQVITRLEAFDSDIGYAGVLTFGCVDKYFSLDPISGDLSVAEPLSSLFKVNADKRKLITHEILISVCDLGDPSLCSQQKLIVHLKAVNLHGPQFDKLYYRVHIPENMAPGTAVVAVVAVDIDSGEDGRVGFKIVGRNEHFEIGSESGIVKIRKSLDREHKAIHRIAIIAHDHGQPMRMAFTNLTVIVDDVNDNPPLCYEPTKSVQIPEDYPNNALVACIAATDADQGKNALISYTFDSNAPGYMNYPFRIDPDSGCVFLKSEKPLNFEVEPFYNLSIEVMDDGEPMLSSICNLVVYLIDVNENLFPPLFNDIAQEASVYENMPVWTEVLALHAVDPDDPKGPIKYSIIGGDGFDFFTIDLQGIIRTSAVLDREISDSYWLTIRAEDMVPVPLASILHVFIRILDRNDHVPVPLKPIYFTTIAENSPENTVVVKVEAIDRDEETDNHGGHSSLRYRILSGNPQSFFAIDSKTGYMITRGKRRLDRETQQEHLVMVEICDQGEPKLCTSVPVAINVSDLNDNSPVFKHPAYNFNVLAGSLGELCRVFAYDVDEGLNGEIRYNVTQGGSQFSIDSNGRIFSSSPLKANDKHTLEIQAADMGTPRNLASIRVTLTAIERITKSKQNRKPKLINVEHWSRLSISDADSVGVTIGLIEAEDPDGDQLWWKIIDGNENNIFAMRCDAGELFLAKSLDVINSSAQEAHLKFSVTDGLATQHGTVIIEISRVHRSLPVFSAQHYKAQVFRLTPVGTVILAISASIEKQSSLSPSLSSSSLSSNTINSIIYGFHLIENVAAAEKLRIDPSNGNVVVVEPLSDLVAQDFTIILSARHNQYANYAKLSITLYDEINNAPKFIESEYSVKVPNWLPVNKLLLTVRARDADLGDNGIIHYSILEADAIRLFTIDGHTGEIRNSRTLSSTDFHGAVFTVRARNQNSPTQFDDCVVRIGVLSGQGERVKFPRSIHTMYIREGLPINSLVKVLAIDGSSNIRYRLSDPCPSLSVHPISGAVYTRASVGIEISNRNCTLIARNAMGIEDSMFLNIKVISENKCAPFFDVSVYEGFIQENMPIGSSVSFMRDHPLIVKAIDHDKGINGLINYRILSPFEPYFTVDFVSGSIRTKAAIDYEKIKFWSFYVEASDMGTSPLISMVPALVQVSIIDMNDEPPRFTKKEYTVDLLLPTTSGVTVITVKAIDVDTVGQLRYAITSSEVAELFTIDAKNGRVSVVANNSADFRNNFYEVSLVVSDGVKSDSATLRIHIQNTTLYNSPIRFEHQIYRTSLIENFTSNVFEHLLTVVAKSNDSNHLIYSFLNPNEYFSVGAATGLISWSGRSIDREKDPMFRLVLQAKSMNDPEKRAQCLVIIKIQDINDCNPIFLNLPYNAVISQNARPGDKVISIKAIDADEGVNGIVRYRMKQKSPYFDINKYDGKITIKTKLDNIDSRSILLEVIASDQGEPKILSSTAIVHVNIVDELMPIFSKNFYAGHISESAPLGSSVLTVQATSNVGGRIGYNIKHGDHRRRFKIDFDTGSISVRNILDRERCPFYNLTVVAIDVTRSNTFAECNVLIELKDVNDNAPEFKKLVYEVNVSESAPVGSELIMVEAFDPDLEGSVISYSVSGENSSVIFLDSSGLVTLNRQLDYEIHNFYSFSLIASDALHLTGEAVLLLHVLDANDIAPTFITHAVYINVDMASAVGQFITKLEVDDRDTVSSLPDGHRYLFSIIDGDETLFNVHKHTGVVSLSRTITADDRLEGLKKVLNVSVSDGIYADYCQLFITMIGGAVIEAQSLRFERVQYISSIKENGLTGMTLMTVGALHGIEPLQYSFAVCEKCTWPVTINQHTGKITTRTSLDYEKRNAYRIPLMVTDANQHSAFSMLTLNVLDENDNAPRFLESNLESVVLASTPVGHSILMMFAVDDDLDDELEYAIVSGNGRNANHFAIHPKQGVLTVQKSLIDSVGERLSLVIRATDSANPPHQCEATVIFHVVSNDKVVPKFYNRHYLITVAEDTAIGKVIGHLQHDLRSDMPGVMYSLANRSSQLPFSVNSRSGELIVSSALNREEANEHRFYIRLTAKESDRLGNLALVTVRVTDINDNKPEFESWTNEVFIAEDAPLGASVAAFVAVDRDYGPNAEMTYAIERGDINKTFRMDKDFGWLLLAKSLDREVMDKYMLTVSATDQGNLKTEKNISVLVKDINDSPPCFDQSRYEAVIDSEHLEIGQMILQFNVSDADLPPNNSTKLFITSGNDDDLFAIHFDMRLVVNRLSHTNYSRSFSLQVLAFDGKYAAVANVSIRIRANASKTFHCAEKAIIRNISENLPINSVILEGFGDELKLARYTLNPINTAIGAHRKKFAIQENGNVVLVEKLTSDESDRYEIHRRVDSNQMVCLEKIVVNVESVANHSPKFVKTVYHAAIAENVNASNSVRGFIFRFDANDGASNEIEKLKYAFGANISQSNRQIFHLDPIYGVITTMKSLDRESQNRYEIPVKAFNEEGMKAEALLIVDVLDVNDNPPVFEQNSVHLQVAEDEGEGFEIYHVKAYGGDNDDESVTYRLDVPHDIAQYLSLDERSGLLKLAQSLDFEKLQRFTVNVLATDSGNPPLSSRCSIEVEVLDVNDNPPRFTQSTYKATVPENVAIGTRVVQVYANDADSEHFGRVSYSLIGENLPFKIEDDGWIKTTDVLDRETISTYELNVKASDGGSPALNDQAVVVVEVDDVNDNAPVFKLCNMTAVIQEGVDPGHILLKITLSDADAEPNAGPFKLEIKGERSSLFAFDMNMNLITTKRLTHTKKDVFLLTVIAYDNGGRSTQCPLTIFIREESQYAPVVQPLRVMLNTLMGEFLGGKIGRIVATDKDSSDILRYSIDVIKNGSDADVNAVAPKRIVPFSINPESGEVIGEADILAGTYRFNVSVTDSKFVTRAPVTVQVTSINQDALDHSVSVRLRGVDGHKFFSSYAQKFYHSLSNLLNVKSQNIHLLSMQTAAENHIPHRRLRLRHALDDLDILFAISRTDRRGYHRPSYVRQRIEENIADFGRSFGLEVVSLVTEICRRDMCVHGECSDRLYLDDLQQMCFMSTEHAFSAPKHTRTFECNCRDGFGGRRCDVAVDRCSREQCTKHEMCIPMNTEIGFECVCPPGSMGERCSESACTEDKQECSRRAEISVNGDGFFQMTVSNSLERRLELGISFRTISRDAVMMYGSGSSDFHILEVTDGQIQYRWDCGTGPGSVKINQVRVSDGQWHSIKISRRSRHTKLVLDDVHKADGDSPHGSDVLNLFQDALRLSFGAMVSYRETDSTGETASDLKPMISNGMVGCFGRILLDGFDVAKTKQGFFYYNTHWNCDTDRQVPCLSNPCGNQGTCVATGQQSYNCVCPPRYSGANCEIDLAACTSRPCPPGVPCTNLHNDFYCSCPHGFTGKTCQLRGEWDPCTINPCGEFGKCIRLPHSTGYICNCSHGYSGTSCRDRIPSLIGDGWFLSSLELIGLGILILLIMIFASVIVCICMRNQRYKYRKGLRQKDAEYETNNMNPRVPKSYDTAPQSVAPPPLPPRASRMHSGYLSNFERAQLTGLPTVQVRPLPVPERSTSSIGGGSRSPSLAGSARCRTRRAETPGSHKNIDFVRLNTSCDDSESMMHSGNNCNILRNFGELVVEEEDGIASGSSSHTQFSVDGRRRPRRSHRSKRVHDLQCSEHQPTHRDWRVECDQRINGACDAAAEHRSERMKLPINADSRANMKKSSPKIAADDDYMTMKPAHRRVIPNSTESQRRPLLETSDSDGMESSDFMYPDEQKTSQRRKPLPPAHSSRRRTKNQKDSLVVSRVYDEPTPELAGIRVAKQVNSSAADQMRTSSSQTQNFCNIDESDSETRTDQSHSSSVQQTMAVL